MNHCSRVRLFFPFVLSLSLFVFLGFLIPPFLISLSLSFLSPSSYFEKKLWDEEYKIIPFLSWSSIVCENVYIKRGLVQEL